ncbi:UPF0481 protein At3g47200-like [Aristolochia californica]|uniref:UPF0481 protein At3g47200-like n=1 Tax=Aristolochia californica TaxID=171875 RepID=UPI0035D661E8
METKRLSKETEISVETAYHSEEQIAETTKADTIIDIELLEKLTSMSQEEEAEERDVCCIYRVPSYIKDLDPEAYIPKLVSFGPYHHGAPHLMSMEKHKHKTLAFVLKRSKKSLEDYLRLLKAITKRLMESYKDLDDKWREQDKFLQLMVLDGVFWLEMYRVYIEKDQHQKFDNSENHSLFSSSGAPFALCKLLNDMILLENQLPNFLLESLSLLTKEPAQQSEEQAVLEFLKFERWERQLQKVKPEGQELDQELISKEPLHFLDYRRKRMIGFYTRDGIVFRRKDKSFPLMGSAFSEKVGIQSHQKIWVNRTSEIWLLNMMAFEHQHGVGYEISAYLIFFVSPGNDESAVFQQKLRYNLEYLSEIQEYYKMKMRPSRFDLLKKQLQETYFKSPWDMINFVTSMGILNGLTAIATLYTILAYYN